VFKSVLRTTGSATSPRGGALPLDFDDVYARHFAFVWRCLRGLGISEVALDDACQDVFVVVHRNLPEFRSESTLPTWLFGIARNVASNHRRAIQRKQAPVVVLDEETAGAAHEGPGPLERAQDHEAAEFVQHFMDGLDEPKRALFVLAFLEESPIPDVAAALGIPLNTAYSRLRRLREDFGRALATREARRGGPP